MKKTVKDKVDLFGQFPCSKDDHIPSKNELQEAFGEQDSVDTKRLTARWLHQQ